MQKQLKRYFFDTEFIEHFIQPWMGKRRHAIDLISIAIVCEDGREYFAISNEYSYQEASEWVQENVIIPLYKKTVSGDARNHINAENFQRYYGKSSSEIKKEILEFTNCKLTEYLPSHETWEAQDEVEFYAWYADYDWVLLCSIFGTMMDLPKEFPMYCRDLKQMLDYEIDKSSKYINEIKPGTGIKTPMNKNQRDEKMEKLKNLPEYPKQETEHDALDDARWNKKLFEFIIQFLY